MKKGDLVTSCYKGLYEIIDITKRWENKNYEMPFERRAYCYQEVETSHCGEEMSSLVTIRQRYSDTGKPVKTTRNRTCDIGFCKPASEFINEKTLSLEEELTRFKHLNKQLITVDPTKVIRSKIVMVKEGESEKTYK